MTSRRGNKGDYPNQVYMLRRAGAVPAASSSTGPEFSSLYVSGPLKLIPAVNEQHGASMSNRLAHICARSELRTEKDKVCSANRPELLSIGQAHCRLCKSYLGSRMQTHTIMHLWRGMLLANALAEVNSKEKKLKVCRLSCSAMPGYLQSS
jgi:hypothetical protein